MIISLLRRNIYIANIKVASTAIEAALRHDGNVALVETEHGKHLYLSEVEQKLSFLFGPEGIRSFKVFGSIRHPMQWLISTYRSHAAEQFAGTENSSRGLSFVEYVERQLDRGWDQLTPQLDRFRYANGDLAPVKWIPIGNAAQFLTDEWFSGEFEVQLPTKNVSFAVDGGRISCSAAMIRKLARIYADDIRAYLAVIGEAAPNMKARAQVLRRALNDFNASLDARQDHQLTDWQVVQCYRALLRRDPESQEAIRHHRKLGTLQRVIEEITASPEYSRVGGGNERPVPKQTNTPSRRSPVELLS